MNNKSEEETDHIVAVHGVDADANNNTQEVIPLFYTLCHAAVATLLSQTHNGVPLTDNEQEGTSLFDTLCCAAAVVTLLPQTHNNVTLPGTPQCLSATINARDTPNLLNYHHLLIEHITSQVVERDNLKPKTSNKQKQ